MAEPTAPALGTLGRTGSGLVWSTRRELLEAAESRAAVLRRDTDTVLRIDPADPLGTVVGLLAAESLAVSPVVVPDDLGGDAAEALLATARSALGSSSTLGANGGGGLLVLSTSGSRGRPRAVVRSTASWTASLLPFSRVTGIRAAADGTVWAPGSLGSTLTLWAVWHALASGVPVVATGAWAPRHVQAVTSGRRPLWIQTVPAVAEQLAEQLGGAWGAGSAPAPRLVVLGGATTPDSLRTRLRAHAVPVTSYYGAAELSFVAADPDGAGLRPFPGVAVRIEDGEIWVRSRYLARGYLGEPGGLSIRDGWATVHDRGSWREPGLLRVEGRGGAAIIVGGTTVLAADVEAVLAGAPAVAEVVCLPEPDPRLGQRIVAVVRVLAGGSTPPHDLVVAGLRTVAKEQLAPASRPSRYVVRTEFPLTSAGKTARDRLAHEVSRQTT